MAPSKHKKIDLPPYRGEIAETYSRPEWLSVLGDPQKILAGPGAEILLDGRNKVGAVTVDLGPSRSADLVVKEFRSRGITRLKSLFGKSKAEKAWRGAAALMNAGLDTPFPVAFLEKRRKGFVEESFFLSERIRGAPEIRGLFRELAEGELRPLLASLAETLFRSHEKGILHRDLSDGNILVKKDGDSFRFFFLDTNRIRRRRKIGELGRAKGLIRLGVPPGLRLYFLGRYSAAGGRPLRNSFLFWYKLNKAAFAGWIRFKKALRLKKISRKLRIQ